MRGKVAVLALFVVILRITPAYAGKSSRLEETPADAEDHPRLCGEKRAAVVDIVETLGSPPPMRGKDELVPFTPPWCGITPAYAGKRPRTEGAHPRYRDHPRLCGEK